MRHAQLYLKDRKMLWVIHGIDLSQGSHGLFMAELSHLLHVVYMDCFKST